MRVIAATTASAQVKRHKNTISGTSGHQSSTAMSYDFLFVFYSDLILNSGGTFVEL